MTKPDDAESNTEAQTAERSQPIHRLDAIRDALARNVEFDEVALDHVAGAWRNTYPSSEPKDEPQAKGERSAVLRWLGW